MKTNTKTKDFVDAILSQLQRFGETITSVEIENDCLHVQYKGAPLGYVELKSLECIADHARYSDGLNKFIAYKFSGEYCLNIPIVNAA